jgi:predicted ATPase
MSCDALCATGSQRCSENNARSLTGLGFQVVAIAVSAVEMKIGDNRG